jgi:hypothetical protein
VKIPTVAGLTFDAGPHEYRVDGVLAPSVTQILSAVGAGWRGPSNEMALARGAALHESVRLYHAGTFDAKNQTDGWTEIVKPYFDGFTRFMADTGFKIENCEVMVFNQRLFYAGTLDLVGKLHGKTVILDLKTGNGPASAGLQLAAYTMCLPRRLPRLSASASRF